jgi:hypothetical protein
MSTRVTGTAVDAATSLPPQPPSDLAGGRTRTFLAAASADKTVFLIHADELDRSSGREMTYGTQRRRHVRTRGVSEAGAGSGDAQR